MEEETIKFETALSAKEKGFNWNTKYFFEEVYQDNKWISRRVHNGHFETDWNDPFLYNPAKCSCPTQSLLQKWLREVHNIHIYIEPAEDNTYEYVIVSDKIEEDTEDNLYHDSYEEALEYGLFEALKLIS